MNFLKIALTFVLAMAISGAFAQASDVVGDGAAFATNYETAGQATVGTTYIMEGTTVPMFALPDDYFHPDYDNVAEDYTLNAAGFTWVWTEGTGTLSITQPNGASDNYVTVSAVVGDAAGSPYTINVLETAPLAWGSCNDGAGEDITVNVVTEPSVTIGGSTTYNFCAGSGSLPTDIQSVISGGWQNYRMTWTLEIATLDDLSAKEFYYSDETGAGQAAGQFYAVDYDEAGPQLVANAGVAPDLMTVGSFDVINNGTNDAVTVYTYILNKINDQASRYGQFLAKLGVEGAPETFNYYPLVAAPETVVVTVYPSPNTGPIYHINSSWSDNI